MQANHIAGNRSKIKVKSLQIQIYLSRIIKNPSDLFGNSMINPRKSKQQLKQVVIVVAVVIVIGVVLILVVE